MKPAAGRVFNPEEDDRIYQGHPVAVLSHGYWVSRFALDPGLIGRKILVNDHPMTIVGVSAEGFAGVDPAQSPQIRVPANALVRTDDAGAVQERDERHRGRGDTGRLAAGDRRRVRVVEPSDA